MSVTINGTTGIAGVDGSASTPAYQGADTNTGIAFPAADTVSVATGGTERMRIDSSGNVRVGTTSTLSGFRLAMAGGGTFISDVNKTVTGGGNIQMYTSDSQAADIGPSIGFGGYYIGTSSDTEWAQIAGRKENGTSGNYSGYLQFSTRASGGSTTERMRINSDGYFKSSNNGTYYAGSSATVHEFNQSADAITLSLYSGNTSLSTAGIAFLYANRNTTNSSFYAISYYNLAATAYKFRVADSGTVTNTTGTYTTISDIKLKQDITDASSQWNDIKSLRIVNYRLKDYVQADPNSKPFLGLIAQEVEQVCPGLVEEQEDEIPDENGNLVKNGEVTKGVKTSILYMKAVKALQEAMERIEQLEAKVTALEASNV